MNAPCSIKISELITHTQLTQKNILEKNNNLFAVYIKCKKAINSKIEMYPLILISPKKAKRESKNGTRKISSARLFLIK